MVGGLSSVVNYSYDITNRLVEVDGVDCLWDDNGYLLFDGEKFYSYDYANRLTSVILLLT